MTHFQDANFWSFFREVFALSGGYNTLLVTISTTALGVAAASIGSIALLRKRALMGDALAHSTLPGLAFGYIIASLLGDTEKNTMLLLVAAAISGGLGVFAVHFLENYSRLRQDAAIGIVLSSFFGLGIVGLSIVQSMPQTQGGGLTHFIYGQTAAMSVSDAWTLLGVMLVSLIVCVGMLKEFRLVCFDESFARASGWPVVWIDLLMMLLVVVVTVLGLQAVGLLLVIALLVVPAAASRFWTERLHKMLLIAALIGGISGYIGSSVSAMTPHFPAGAVIVLTAGTLFFMSYFFAPKRGALAHIWRQLVSSMLISRDHILRDLFERDERLKGSTPTRRTGEYPLSTLIKGSTRTQLWTRLILSWLKAKKELLFRENSCSLTETGYQQALNRVRSHRLWEEYIYTYSDVPRSHVDFSADMVEHVLSPEIVKSLEKSLSAKGIEVPPVNNAPPSLHANQGPEK